MNFILKTSIKCIEILLIYGILQKTIGLKQGRKLSIYFGVPGAGKTTFAAWIVRKKTKKLNKKIKQYNKMLIKNPKKAEKIGKWIDEHKNIYSNIAIKGTYKYDKEDIGKYDIQNGTMILDEAGIEFNNRNYKAFPKKAISWFKLHRHYKCDVEVFSQSHEDTDVTLRRLAQKYYVMSRSIIPGFVLRKEIKRKIGINEITHQIEDRYYFAFLGLKWIFCPTLWKLFDSEEAPTLEKKKWEYWNKGTYEKKEIEELIN